jgi:mycothiol synthase
VLVSTVPALPEGLSARPLRTDDIAAIADLLEAAEPVDDTGEHENADDLRAWFVNDRIDLATDSRVVVTGEGRVVGWATVMDLGDHRDEYALRLDGRVHPYERGRGIGRALLEWQLARSRELHRDRHPEMGARFAVGVTAAHERLLRLVTRLGFVPVQYFFSMQRPLTDLPAVPVLDGTELAPYDWERDDEMRRIHNVCFVDHFGTAERDSYTWQTFFTGQRGFRPDLSRIALADGAILGYALVYEHEAETAATGLRVAYFGQIGVLPAARGRRIGVAVIAAALQAAAANGADGAGLTVDSENTTGALRLYERLGFEVTRRETVWAFRAAAVDGAPVA